MERYVERGRLVERNVLTRPGEQDVVVVRHFIRADQDVMPTAAAVAASSGRSVATQAQVADSERQTVSQAAEVAEVTRQRRELIGVCGVLVAAGACSCARACRSGGTR